MDSLVTWCDILLCPRKILILLVFFHIHIFSDHFGYFTYTYFTHEDEQKTPRSTNFLCPLFLSLKTESSHHLFTKPDFLIISKKNKRKSDPLSWMVGSLKPKIESSHLPFFVYENLKHFLTDNKNKKPGCKVKVFCLSWMVGFFEGLLPWMIGHGWLRSISTSDS